MMLKFPVPIFKSIKSGALPFEATLLTYYGNDCHYLSVKILVCVCADVYHLTVSDLTIGAVKHMSRHMGKATTSA